MITPDRLDPSDVQGNILRGYRKPFVRHLVLGVRDPAAARRWLLDATGGDEGAAPQVTTAEPWSDRPATCLNVAVTHPGLAALGLGPQSLDSFPHEFRDGMASRAMKLGDTGPSDPSRWMTAWREESAGHLVVTVHGDEASALDPVTSRVLGASSGEAFRELGRHDGACFPGGTVHFGFVDGIAQPRFEGVHDEFDRPDGQPMAELGAVLLGHPTPFADVVWELPQPEVLGRNGCFNAFRVLEQDVEGFERYLTEQAERLLDQPVADELLAPGIEATWDPPTSRTAALREVLAAKMMGRWRDGTPVSLSPTGPTSSGPGDRPRNDFGYADDPDGLGCPMGSHIRRCNPRDGRIVQRGTNHTRRLVRRGIPYGPPYDPGRPTTAERGLLGAFLCGSLVAQFEAMQYDWMNLGLQDPRITGTNDPVAGNNEPPYSSFTIPTSKGDVVLRDLPRFVTTRGGAYLFVPSLAALRHLGTGGA